MDIIAHSGPNNCRAPLAISSTNPPLVALASRGTVLIYPLLHSGAPTELRTTGKGIVTSIAFNHAPALRYLLVVATGGGFVTVFDVQAKRIFSRVVDPRKAGLPAEQDGKVCHVQFLEWAPHLVMIVYEGSRVCFVNFRTGEQVFVRRVEKLYFIRHVPHTKYFVMCATVSDEPAVLLVCWGGEESSIWTVANIRASDVVIRKDSDDCNAWSIVVLSTFRTPFVVHFSVGSGIGDAPSLESEEMLPVDATKNHDIRVVGTSYRDLTIISDKKGGIHLCQTQPDHTVKVIGGRPDAHERQIYSLIATSDGFLASASQDRTLAVWQILREQSEKPHLRLLWRTLRTNGAVTALSISPASPTFLPEKSLLSMGDCEDARVLSFASARGAIMCMLWKPDIGRFHVMGEIGISGSALGARKREAFTKLVPNRASQSRNEETLDESRLAGFIMSNGGVGAIGFAAGRLELFSSAKEKGNTKQRRPCDLAFGRPGVLISADGSTARVEWKASKTGWKNRGLIASKRLSPFTFEDDTPTASCTIQIPDRYDCYTIVGTQKGKIVLFRADAGAEQLASTEEHSQFLPSIRAIAAQSSSSGEKIFVAVCDQQGQLHVCLIYQDVPSTAEKRFSVLFCAEETGLKFGKEIAFMSWSEIVEASDETSKAYLATASSRGGLYIWEVSVEHCVTKISIMYEKDDMVITSLETRKRGNVQSLNLRAELKENQGTINAVAWYKNRFVFTAGEDGTVRSWDIERQPMVQSKRSKG